MNAPDSYCIPTAYGEAEFKEKRSRFIARVWPVEEETEALAHIAAMRRQHWDAAHNVYAYVIRGGPTRYSDDGEPQGTSGLPTLHVFESTGVTNFCCVVTRYFGGILLGAGGLVRAYSRAAKEGLHAAGVTLMRLWDVLLIACPYPLYERIRALITETSGIISTAEFAADITLEVLTPVEHTGDVIHRILDMSAGVVEPLRLESVFRGVRLS